MSQEKQREEVGEPAPMPEDAPPPIVIRPRPVPRERNRVLVIMLAGFAALVFITVIVLSALFHYVDVNHALQQL